MRPLLAVLTESDAISTEVRLVETTEALRSAIVGVGADNEEDYNEEDATGGVSNATPHPVSVRGVLIEDDEDHRWEEVGRVMRLVQGLWGCCHGKKSAAADRGSPLVVISTGDTEVLADVAVSCNDEAATDNIDDFDGVCGVGVQVKERDLESIPVIRAKLAKERPTRRGAMMPVIGASVHSVPSAMRGAELSVDYLIVGTCCPTASHPEKLVVEYFEGPDLPGVIRGELMACARGLGGRSDVAGGRRRVARVFGIVGVNAENCAGVIKRGADGVAVMRGCSGPTSQERPVGS